MDILSKREHLWIISVAEKRQMFSLCIHQIEKLILSSVLYLFYESDEFQNVVRSSDNYKNHLIDLKNQRRRVAVYEAPRELHLHHTDDHHDDLVDFDAVTDNVLDTPTHGNGILSISPYASLTPVSAITPHQDSPPIKLVEFLHRSLCALKLDESKIPNKSAFSLYTFSIESVGKFRRYRIQPLLSTDWKPMDSSYWMIRKMQSFPRWFVMDDIA